MIKEYMDIGVRNDEQLIKLATIIQRLEVASNKGEGNDMFDFSDLQDLLEEQDETKEELEEKVEKEDKEE